MRQGDVYRSERKNNISNKIQEVEGSAGGRSLRETITSFFRKGSNLYHLNLKQKFNLSIIYLISLTLERPFRTS